MNAPKPTDYKELKLQLGGIVPVAGAHDDVAGGIDIERADGTLAAEQAFDTPVVQPDTREMLRAGEPARALRYLDTHIKANPRDTAARFLKGVVLSEQGDPAGATDVFRALIRDYPELPEPYNNLAVLYAASGDYRAARDALDMAVRVKPDYATAYENLGDVHVLLAQEAYDKALAIGTGNNARTRAKLKLARELTEHGPRAVLTP